MTSVSLRNDVYITKYNKSGSGIGVSSKYRDLENHLEGETEIRVQYEFGMSSRLRHLKKLGFALKEVKHGGNSLGSTVTEVWVKN